MKLANKLTLFFLCIAIIVSAVLFVISYLNTSKVVEDEVVSRMEEYAYFTMDLMERFLYERLSDLEVICNDSVVSSEDSTVEQITERLKYFKNSQKCYASVSFFNLERVRIADTTGLSIGKKDSNFTDWDTVLNYGVSSARDVVVSKTLNVPVVFFASLVKDKDNRPLGIVMTRVLASDLYELVCKSNVASRRNEKMLVDLLDKDGRLIYSSDRHCDALGYCQDMDCIIRDVKNGKISSSGRFLSGKEESFYVYCTEQGYLSFKGNNWLLVFHMPTRLVFSSMNKVLKILVILFLLSLPLLVLVTYIFGKTAAAPLNILNDAVIEIGKGNLNTVVNIKSKDEVGILVSSFNKMAVDLKEMRDKLEAYNVELEQKIKERTVELENSKVLLEDKVKQRTMELKGKYDELVRSQTAMLYMVEDLNEREKELRDAQDKLVRSEKLAVIGKLASSVAHEIRNPLGVMKNVLYYFNMLNLGKDNPDIKENLDILSQEIENSDKIISDLLEFSRVKKPTLRLEDVNVIVNEAVRRINVPANVKVVTELSSDLPNVEIDALQIQQVFYNIASNAIQAMDKGGVLNIKTRRSEDHFIEALFSDTGSGISEENLTKIFDPLFSTKTNGTGLGLSVVASIVEGHNGKIEIQSELGKGSLFTVKLPIKRG